MNREEAIKWLKAIEKKYIHGGDEEYDNLRKIALHMAIEALEQAEIIRCDSCRFKLWDAFSYPCIDCGRGFLHYEATNILPSESADRR